MWKKYTNFEWVIILITVHAVWPVFDSWQGEGLYVGIFFFPRPTSSRLTLQWVFTEILKAIITAIVCIAPVIDCWTSLTDGVRRNAGKALRSRLLDKQEKHAIISLCSYRSSVPLCHLSRVSMYCLHFPGSESSSPSGSNWSGKNCDRVMLLCYVASLSFTENNTTQSTRYYISVMRSPAATTN